jgi:hypothetical protein
LLARHARFNRDVEVVDADANDPIQVAQVDADAAVQRVDVCFERRARAERHNRHAVTCADLDDRRNLLSRPRKADHIGCGGRMV